MNTELFQELIDRLRSMSSQRWVLVVSAVVSAAAAAAACEVASERYTWGFVVFIAAIAAIAAARPDSHTALFVVAVVVVRWLAVIDDVTTWWSIVEALGLFAFHTLVALMAVTPPSGVVDQQVLRRWLRRSAWVVVATGAVWALVSTVHGQRLDGNTALTLAAFIAVAAAVALLLARSLDGRTTDP